MVEHRMYHVVFKKSAEKQFHDLREKDQKRVLVALRAVAADPFQGKKLQGKWDGRYAVRVWPYRIVYAIDRGIITVTVVSIAHRKDVYR